MVDVDAVRAAATASAAQDEVGLKAAALDALHERVAVVDVDGRVLTVNHAWRQFAARPLSPAHARIAPGADYLRAVDHGMLDEPAMALPPAAGTGIRAVLLGDRPRFQCEYSLRSPGGPAWFLMVVASMGGSGRGPVVVSHIEIAARSQIEADPAALGNLHDPLTGLPTRTLLRDRLAMSLAQRPVDDRRTAVFVVGLEDMQVIADDLGPFVVDEVLIELVRRLQATVRPGDTIARIGPGQVAFVCGAVRGSMGVQAIRMRLARILGEPVRVTGHPAPVWIRTTIGSALDGVEAVEPDGLLLAADLSRQVAPPTDAA